MDAIASRFMLDETQFDGCMRRIKEIETHVVNNLLFELKYPTALRQ